jgi:hypothetical protein
MGRINERAKDPGERGTELEAECKWKKYGCKWRPYGTERKKLSQAQRNHEKKGSTAIFIFPRLR